MAHTRVERVEDVLKEGDKVEVKVIAVDREGKIRLTRRELLPFPEGEEGERASGSMQAREAGPPAARTPSRRPRWRPWRRSGPRTSTRAVTKPQS